MYVRNYCRERCAKRKEAKEQSEKHGRRGAEVSGDGRRVALPWFGVTYMLTSCFYDLE